MNLLIIVPLEVTPDNAQMILSQAMQEMFGWRGPNRTVHVCVNETADKVLALMSSQEVKQKLKPRGPQKKDPAHEYAKR